MVFTGGGGGGFPSPGGGGGEPLSARSIVTVWPSEVMLSPCDTGTGRNRFVELTVKLPASTPVKVYLPVWGSLLTTVGNRVSYTSQPTSFGLVETRVTSAPVGMVFSASS